MAIDDRQRDLERRVVEHYELGNYDSVLKTCTELKSLYPKSSIGYKYSILCSRNSVDGDSNTGTESIKKNFIQLKKVAPRDEYKSFEKEFDMYLRERAQKRFDFEKAGHQRELEELKKSIEPTKSLKHDRALDGLKKKYDKDIKKYRSKIRKEKAKQIINKIFGAIIMALITCALSWGAIRCFKSDIYGNIIWGIVIALFALAFGTVALLSLKDIFSVKSNISDEMELQSLIGAREDLNRYSTSDEYFEKSKKELLASKTNRKKELEKTIADENANEKKIVERYYRQFRAATIP